MQPGHAFSSQAEDRSGLSSCRHLDPGPTVQGGNLQIRSQGSLSEADGSLHDQIAIQPLEESVRLDIYDHIKIAGDALGAGRIPLAAELEVLAVLHARRDLDIDLASLSCPSRAAAVLAGAGDELSPAAALGTGGGGDHLAEGGVLGPGYLARAPTGAAGHGTCAGLSPAALALGAVFRPRNLYSRLQAA